MFVQRLLVHFAGTDHAMGLAQPALHGRAVDTIAQQHRIFVVIGVAVGWRRDWTQPVVTRRKGSVVARRPPASISDHLFEMTVMAQTDDGVGFGHAPVAAEAHM